MKFLIVLALALAVTSAAFTGSLVQQAQPLVSQIKADFAVNIRARSSAEVGLQTGFGEAIQQHINEVLAQIESTIQQVQATAGQVASAVASALSQLQSLGAGAAQQVQTILGSLFGNLFGGNSRANIEITPQISAIIRDLLSRPNVQAAIHGSALFQCINSNLQPQGGLTLQLLATLNQNNQLTVENLLNSNAVKPCIAAQGGLGPMLANSQILARIRQLIISNNLQAVAESKILEVLGAHWGGKLLEILNLNGNFERASIEISAEISAIIQGLLSRPNVQAAIHGSQLFQCVNANLQSQGGLTLQFVAQLNQNNLLTPEYLLNNPNVKPCLDAQGGIIAIIQNSALVARVKDLIQSFGLQAVVREKILEILGSNYGPLLVDLLDLDSRGVRLEISVQLLAIIQGLLARPNVQAAIHGSALFQCINTNLQPQGGLTLALLGQLNAAGNLNLAYLQSIPAVSSCLTAQGGLSHIIQTSPLVAQVHQLVQSLGLQEVVKAKLIEILGEQVANQLFALLRPNARGIFDGFSQVWESISAQASSIGAMLSGIASQAWASIQEKFEMVKAIAAAFVAGGLQTAQNIGLQAAQSLIDLITPYYEDLGELYHQTVAQLQSIYQGLIVPNFA